MDEIIIFKGGVGNGGKDGVVKVSREDGSANVFLALPRPDAIKPDMWPIIARFSPLKAREIGEALIRLSLAPE